MRSRAVSVASPDGGTRRVLSPLDAFLHIAGHAVYSDLLRDPVAALRGPIDLAVLCEVAPMHTIGLLAAARELRLGVPVAIAIGWCGVLDAKLSAQLLETAADAKWLRPTPRQSLGRRQVLRNARRALEGEPMTSGPATAWRALLAPSLGSAFSMLREGIRRRTTTSS